MMGVGYSPPSLAPSPRFSQRTPLTPSSPLPMSRTRPSSSSAKAPTPPRVRPAAPRPLPLPSLDTDPAVPTGTPQLLSNISACLSIAQTVSSTLGPRGMDKLIVGDNGQATISNDGATILKLLDIVHPAAKSLVDIARAQDAEVGDGTTSVVLLAAEFLRESKSFIEDGVSPHIIIKGFRKAAQLVRPSSPFFHVCDLG